MYISKFVRYTINKKEVDKMEEIIFPGLGIKFNISNIAFKIADVSIYWYSLLIILALIISILGMKKENGKYGIKFDDIVSLLIYVIPISLICARLYFVIFNLEYYLKNPIQILNIRNGGLAIYGGIIGGIVTIYAYCKKNKINILNMLDFIVPYLSLGQSIGRWGNFFNVEAYGYNTSNLLRMGITKNGIYQEVHPTFLYESIATMLIFILLISLRNKRKYNGQQVLIYCIGYSFIRIWIEGIRVDSLMLGNFRISQVISIVLFVICIGIIIRKFNLKNQSSTSN